MCHYPNDGYKSARDAKRSPIHDRVAARFPETFYRDVSGFEAPMYHDSVKPEWGFKEENYHPVWKREHAAVRDDVGFIDMSFMSKFLVQGRDAGAFLNSLCTADVVGGGDNKIVYTQWLDEFGKMQVSVPYERAPHT